MPAARRFAAFQAAKVGNADFYVLVKQQLTDNVTHATPWHAFSTPDGHMATHATRAAAAAPQPLPSWLARAVEARLTGAEAAGVLVRLGSDAVRARDLDAAWRYEPQARRLATHDAAAHLLDLAESRSAGLATLAVALRYRGPVVLAEVLERLNGADDLGVRRVHLQLAVALGRFPELRGPLVAQLVNDLASRQWFVVRNAIGLLADLGAEVPPRHELATHAHRQVRLALTKALARCPRDPNALDALVFLLGDPDPSVRFAAVVALGAADTPRARMALSLHAATETDAETLQACRAVIHRRADRKIA
jgi:hypothetical protein